MTHAFTGHGLLIWNERTRERAHLAFCCFWIMQHEIPDMFAEVRSLYHIACST